MEKIVVTKGKIAGCKGEIIGRNWIIGGFDCKIQTERGIIKLMLKENEFEYEKENLYGDR